ncbi:MAG: Adaptor for signal transduction [Sclerophora amabilis]|nr:MAG: Adaptor for signal transduction [Sclerophora amabilis]
MAFTTAYHEDSDADDEYERSMTSPIHITDSETSPTDSEPPSAEHTPTTFVHLANDRSPRTIMTEWTAQECAEYVSSLGLSQYSDAFLENEVVGEALIALRHDELKELGMASAGHRLTLLKKVYDVKVKQDIPIDPEHYVPLSADTGAQAATATQEDIARIIQSIKIRDERIVQAETELRRLTEEHERLRRELLPVFRMAKDRSQPLPYQPSNYGGESHNYDQANTTSMAQSQMPSDRSGGSLNRKLSNKKFLLGSTPSNSSPTHITPPIHETRSANESALDPSPAAVSASSHLTATMNGGSQPSNSPGQQNVPSPTSPSSHSIQPPLGQRAYNANTQPSSSSRSLFPHPDDAHSSYSQTSTLIDRDRDRSNPTPTPSSGRRAETPASEPPGSGGGTPSVEIFKSFRVSEGDPCYKVLPAALKKYNINADWKQYALYIVYGDEERCLELEEKPLHLFKQLDREGKKPMFMLRRITTHNDPYPPTGVPPSAGLGTQMSNLGSGRGPAYQSGITLPGGVL